MRVIVEVGLLTGAEIDPSYLIIGHPTQGLIGTGKIAEDNFLADYTSRTQSLSVERPSSRRVGPITEYSAGTCNVTVINDDGALDPYTLEQAGLSAPGVILRVRVEHEEIIYPIFYGFVDSWVPVHNSPTHATVNITATDAFGRLAKANRTALASPVGDGETTGARIERILDGVSWPAGMRDIATGDSTLLGTSLDGNALDEAQQVSLNENGELYVNAEGVIVFRNRRAIFTDARSADVQGIFGSDIAGGELPYVGVPGLSYDATQLMNRVTATRDADGAIPQVQEDGDSITRYGLYAHEETLLLNTDSEVANWAAWVVHQNKEPEFRFTSLELDTRVLPELMVPQALGREIGDRITVVRRPPGGIVDERDCFVRSISHSWSGADRWRTTWGLQPAAKFSFFVIGHPQQGVIGQNAIAY